MTTRSASRSASQTVALSKLSHSESKSSGVGISATSVTARSPLDLAWDRDAVLAEVRYRFGPCGMGLGSLGQPHNVRSIWLLLSAKRAIRGQSRRQCQSGDGFPERLLLLQYLLLAQRLGLEHGRYASTAAFRATPPGSCTGTRRIRYQGLIRSNKLAYEGKTGSCLISEIGYLNGFCPFRARASNFER